MSDERPLPGLLRIDYAAERRKLVEASRDAPWRVPAELARRALRAGAGRVSIRSAERRLVVVDDGAAPSEEKRAAHACWCDASAPEDARHAALRVVESEPGWLVAGVEATLERRGRETWTSVPRFALEAQDRAALADALRFSPAPVELDGRPLPRGFRSPLAVGALGAPLEGAVALLASGPAEVALLQDAVVVARVTLPERTGFAAWLDVRSLGEATAEPPSAARVRAAFEPHAEAVLGAALDLALAWLRGLPKDAAAEPACLELLLDAAGHSRRRDEVLEAAILPAWHAGASVRRSLAALEREARADPSGSVTALEPDADPSLYLLPEAPVYRLEPETRARIAGLLGVRFRPAPPRESQAGLVARLRRVLRSTRSAIARGLLALRHPGSGRVLDRAELASDERALVEALGPAVVLTSGAGPVRAHGDAWRLPRQNARVALAARAVARHPRWAWPAALVLFEGRRAAPEPGREAWLTPTGGVVSSAGSRR
jgi:hypothetical protein